MELIPDQHAIDIKARLIVTPNGAVYLESNNTKWTVAGPYYFDNCGFSWSRVQQVTYEYANSLPNGPFIGGK